MNTQDINLLLFMGAVSKRNRNESVRGSPELLKALKC